MPSCCRLVPVVARLGRLQPAGTSAATGSNGVGGPWNRNGAWYHPIQRRMSSNSSGGSRNEDGRPIRRDDEEYQMQRAVRALSAIHQQARGIISIRVEKVQLVGCNFLPPRVLAETSEFENNNNSSIRIHCLTHVDAVSDEALRHQIQWIETADRAKHQEQQKKSGMVKLCRRPLAIFALDLARLRPHGGGVVRELNSFRDALLGAASHYTSPSSSPPMAVISGAPNSGKSSLILPLTRQRTLEVKKKKNYHLPRVSVMAGRTLGLKKHVLPFPRKHAAGTAATRPQQLRSMTLLDTPGLRPNVATSDPRLVAHMLAARVMEPFAGYKDIVSNLSIIQLLLDAVNRHATLSTTSLDAAPQQPLYLELLDLVEPINDAAVLADAYHGHLTREAKKQGKAITRDDMTLIRAMQSSSLGEFIFTPYKPSYFSSASREVTASMTFNRDSALVYMNDEAERLVQVGTGKLECEKIVPVARRKDTLRNVDRTEAVESDKKKMIVFPPHQRDFRCMACAGFVKLLPNGGICGKRHTRAQGWSKIDILSYFSRMSEAFGGVWSGRTRYLMKDSLACTMAMKHKLRSRAAVYKKLGGIREYPVPNALRPRRFQRDQPIPWIHRCERPKTCRSMTPEQKKKFAAKMERLNVTDHTYNLLRKRGLPLPRHKKRKSSKINQSNRRNM